MSDKADDVQKIIEIHLKNFLNSQARMGFLIRDLYIKGEEEIAHKHCTPARAKTLMEFTHFVENSIREGMTFDDALKASIKTEHLDKLLAEVNF